MDYQSDSAAGNRASADQTRGRRFTASGHQENREKQHHGSSLNGVKRQAVSESTQKSQQGKGNSTSTFIAETQTNTVTHHYHF